MSDYDKQQWQAEEAEREAVTTAYRDKMARARERSAANAKRKIARLHAKLTELGHISDFEDEFGESVLERLEKFGSAFHDLEKGRAGDALSAAQKQVVARMNRKVKELKAEAQARAAAGDSEADPDAEYERTADRWRKQQDKPRSSFKSKGRPKWTPRVRQLDDDFEAASSAPLPTSVPPAPRPEAAPFKPKLVDPTAADSTPETAPETAPRATPRPAPYIPDYARDTDGKATAKPKRPFLRIVKSD